MLRFFLALLVILGTYLSAVVVELTYSPNLDSESHAEVQGSDPWEKMRQELAVRRRLALSRNEHKLRPTLATRPVEFETSAITSTPETRPSDR